MEAKRLLVTSLDNQSTQNLANEIAKTLRANLANVAFVEAFGKNGLIDPLEVEKFVSNGNIRQLVTVFFKELDALSSQNDVIVISAGHKFTSNFGFNMGLLLAKHLNALVATLVHVNGNAELIIENEKRAVKLAGVELFGIFAINNAKTNDQEVCCLPDETAPVSWEFLQENLKKSSDLITGIAFEYGLFQKARRAKKTIVLPEGNDDRILKAADVLIKNDVVELILLGDEKEIQARAGDLGLDLSGARVVDPARSELKDGFAKEFYELRKSKGVTLEEAQAKILDPNYFGTMMVHKGLAHGMVSGAIHTTADTIRPALQIIKTVPGISVVSSVFFMCVDTKLLIFADCAVNPNPSAEELAQIAISSAQTAKSFGVDPRLAMLSYSSGNSGSGVLVEKVAKATAILKNLGRDFLVDGPLQFDAATVPSVAKTKMPDSEVAGRANVLIFPDLNTGNNTYKAVQRTSGAFAIGPVLQGLKKPINDLSRGCLVDDIINTVAITAIQGE